MASTSSLSVVLLLCLAVAASAQLSPTFYQTTCPNALSTIKAAVTAAVNKENRMGASLLRLHFHDCFVQGCDASVLLSGMEQNAAPNVMSLRGFEVIDSIKAKLETMCKQTVSCADILTVAARDSVVAVRPPNARYLILTPKRRDHHQVHRLVCSPWIFYFLWCVQLGGPSWTVPLGRRDSTNANEAAANSDLPPPFFDLVNLTQSFGDKGFTVTDMVALSGAHTIGQAQCQNFRDRLYNETNINSGFATSLKANCPRPTGSGDRNLANLDVSTPYSFDNAYYSNLKSQKGLLHSDQVLFTGTGGGTDNIVNNFASNPAAFSGAFASAMVKMGNLGPLTGSQGQVRLSCSKVN
ncbi:Peroxidase 2 [Hordeum vulgare]|nr:Peroxidase 2 [Hordeum vulgare]